jgi:hypothetical protein
LIVILEFLRAQQRVDQIDHQKEADEQHQKVFKIHRNLLLEFVARERIGNRHAEENDRAKNHEEIHVKPSISPHLTSAGIKNL